MKNTHLFGQIRETIRTSNRILLVTDGKADGDSIGSTTAMVSWLLDEGKDVEVFCIEAIPSYLHFLDHAHRISMDPTIFSKSYDLVMTFDASDPARCGLTAHYPKIPTQPHVIVFDHHETNPRYGHTNAIFTDAGSTCEVVYSFFIANDVRLDARMATSLLTGITTDTTSFTNAATTSKGMDAAAHLIRSGARHTDILANVVKNTSMDALKLWGIALSRLRTNEKLGIASTYLLQSDFKKPEDEELVGGLSNFLSGVTTGTDTTLILHERPDGTVRGSFRSVKRDISKLAKLLSGGGHKKAAGFTVKGHIEVTLKGPRIVA
ncbi:MAG: DHH family phosphoesterase [Patescibacteria group bacterium]|jgi:phosphoesterase RecJ-like protein